MSYETGKVKLIRDTEVICLLLIVLSSETVTRSQNSSFNVFALFKVF